MNGNDNNILAQRLKSKRKEFKLTQKKLAEELGVATSVIAGAETKRGISKSLAQKLADYFNTDIEYWLNENAENELIDNLKIFEVTTKLLNKLIEEELLIDDISELDSSNRELLMDSFEFDVKVFLKKQKKKR